MSVFFLGRFRIGKNRNITRKDFLPILGIMLLCAIIIAAIFGCSGGDKGSPGGPQVDTTPPTVVSITPIDGATGVSPIAKVSVTFSENMDSLTVDTGTYRVSDVAGTISCSGNCAEFTASAPMSFNSMHFVTVTVGVTDKAGNHLAERFTSCFRTVVSSENPAANAGVDTVAGIQGFVTLDGTASSDPNSLPLTYQWSQVYGPAVTWIGSTTTATPNFQAPDTVSTLEFRLVVENGLSRSDTDYVSVMVLEDKDHAYWVSSTIGAPGNSGTRTHPFATIQQAIDTANAGGDSSDVYVEAGTYNESLTLRTGISIYGSYQIGYGSVWVRSLALNSTEIVSGTTAVSGAGVSNVVLDGLDISSASPSAPGANSIVVSLSNSDGVVISRNSLLAGSAVGGADGATGVAGANGNSGGNGYSWQCNAERAGGAGGSSSIGCAGGIGGTGKGTYSDGGAGGTEPRPGCAGGGGSAGACALIYAGAGNPGGAGGNGSTGSDGNGGSSLGTLANGVYSPANGVTGDQGSHGCGAGGGGGGGGDCFYCCGGGGGGGGAGGEGGKGGVAGQGGGGSFGIVLTNCSHISIDQSVIITVSGGKGGSGSPGGVGGTGGTGGAGGGGVPNGKPAGGGNGGKGGNGGSGGFGGGGGGGPTICIAMDSQSTEILFPSNTYNPGTAGSGGSGGAAPASRGANGISAETKVF